MSITHFYSCDRCGKSMFEPYGILITDDPTPHQHLCEKCLNVVEDWISGEDDFIGKSKTEDEEPQPNGYVPHHGMSQVICPNCGSVKFISRSQAVVPTEPYWTYEYVCERCGNMVGITVKQRVKG